MTPATHEAASRTGNQPQPRRTGMSKQQQQLTRHPLAEELFGSLEPHEFEGLRQGLRDHSQGGQGVALPGPRPLRLAHLPGVPGVADRTRVRRDRGGERRRGPAQSVVGRASSQEFHGAAAVCDLVSSGGQGSAAPGGDGADHPRGKRPAAGGAEEGQGGSGPSASS